MGERFSTLDRQTFQRTLGTTIVTYLAHRKQSIGILPSCVCASLAGTGASFLGFLLSREHNIDGFLAQGHAERPRRRMELYPQDFPCRYKSQQRLSQKDEDIGYFRDMAEVNAFLETINTQGQRRRIEFADRLHATNFVKRLHQILLIGSFMSLCWRPHQRPHDQNRFR